MSHSSVNNEYLPIINIPITLVKSNVFLNVGDNISDIRDAQDVSKLLYYNQFRKKDTTVGYYYLTTEELPFTIGKLSMFGFKGMVPFFVCRTMNDKQLKQWLSANMDYIEDDSGYSLYTNKKMHRLTKYAGPAANTEISLKFVFKFQNKSILEL